MEKMKAVAWQVVVGFVIAAATLVSHTVAAPAASCAAGQTSTSGVIQLVESSCLGSTNKNDLLAVTGVAFKVDVDAKGVFSLTPIEQGTFRWMGPGPYQLPTKKDPGYNWGDFAAKDANATGVYDAFNKQVANVMFYNDVQGPLSRLVVTGPKNLTLVSGSTIGYKGPGPNCTYTYKVASGCVMGVTPESTPPPCPVGWAIKTGKFNTQYCAPCRVGTSSSTVNSKKCTSCKAGEYNSDYTGACRQCEGAAYSLKPGAEYCSYCSVDAWQYDTTVKPQYLDAAKGCINCPPDSWATQTNPRQCAACSGGARCCRTNPSASCPACKPGFKSSASNVTTTFVLGSASPASCYKISDAVCTPAFTITITPKCTLEHNVVSSLAASGSTPCYSNYTIYTDIVGAKAAPTDLKPFGQYDFNGANISSVNGPLVTFQVYAPAATDNVPPTLCSLTYRAVDKNSKALGVSPAPCPAGKPGCIVKSKPPTCAKGNYVSKNIDGNTLCLKCPPGTYSPTANTKNRCTKCPAGKYANGFGNTACAKCVPGTYSFARFASCQACSEVLSGDSTASGFYAATAGSPSCLPCPLNSAPPGGDAYPLKVTKCLGSVNGALCCAAGDCSGQTACPPGPLPVFLENKGAAIFKLTSSKLSDPYCKYARYISCYAPGGLLAVRQRYQISSVTFKPFNQPGCIITDGGYSYVPEIYADVLAVNRVRFSDYITDLQGNAVYSVVSSKSNRTMTIYFANSSEVSLAADPASAKCSATFTLVAGTVMDLVAPAGATCPTGSLPVTESGHIACVVCESGSIVKKGKCTSCPAGTYQPLDGGVACLPCPSGTQSAKTASSCDVCSLGYAPSPAKKSCVECKANTYAMPGMAKCKACPAGTTAAAGSGVCGTPFPK